MLTVAEIIEAAGPPAGSVSILPMTRELGDRMVADERFKLLTFTGSPSVGWRMKERAGKKKVVLELGGNAGVIVDTTADLDWAVKRILVGAFAYAGQVCISVQRMFIHEAIWDDVHGQVPRGRRRTSRSATRSIRRRTSARWSTQHQAARTQRWVDEAVAMGGKVLAGGKADGTFFPPTVLTDVPVAAQVCSNEAFAPLVVAFTFRRPRRRDRARSTTRCSGSRPGSSPTTSRAPGGRSTSSRSAASSSTTSRPTASTTCPTAASRIPGWGARACAGRSRT